MNYDLETIRTNQSVQSNLQTLNLVQLQTEVATHLHQIWRNTRFIGNDENGNPIYQDRWKQLNPNDSEAEKKICRNVFKTYS